MLCGVAGAVRLESSLCCAVCLHPQACHVLSLLPHILLCVPGCTQAGDYTASGRPPVAKAISKPTDLDAYNALESTACPNGLLDAILQLPDVEERLAATTPEDSSDKINAIVYALLQLLALPPVEVRLWAAFADESCAACNWVA